jgi:hypothetical protein
MREALAELRQSVMACLAELHTRPKADGFYTGARCANRTALDNPPHAYHWRPTSRTSSEGPYLCGYPGFRQAFILDLLDTAKQLQDLAQESVGFTAKRLAELSQESVGFTAKRLAELS